MQKIPLKEHCENNSYPKECRQQPPNKGNFLASIGGSVCGRTCKILQNNFYYSVIADKITDSYVSKELLLLCLRFLQKIGKNVIVQESLLDST